MPMSRAVALALFATAYGQTAPTVQPIKILTVESPDHLDDLSAGGPVSGISDGSKMPCYDGNCPEIQTVVEEAPTVPPENLQASQVTAPPPPPPPTVPATEAPVQVTIPPTPEVTIPPTPEVTVPPTPEVTVPPTPAVAATPEPPTMPPTDAPPTMPVTAAPPTLPPTVAPPTMPPANKDLTTMQLMTMKPPEAAPMAGLPTTTISFLAEDDNDLTGGSGGSPWMWVLILVGIAGIGAAVAYYLGVCGGQKGPKKKNKKVKRAVKESSLVQERELLVADVEAPAAPAAPAPQPVQTISQPMQQFVTNQAAASYVVAPQPAYAQMAVAPARMGDTVVVHPDGSQQVIHPGGSQQVQAAQRQSLFDMMDRNHDGTISRAEFNAGASIAQ